MCVLPVKTKNVSKMSPLSKNWSRRVGGADWDFFKASDSEVWKFVQKHGRN